MDQNEVIIKNIRDVFIEMNTVLYLKKILLYIMININKF